MSRRHPLLVEPTPMVAMTLSRPSLRDRVLYALVSAVVLWAIWFFASRAAESPRSVALPSVFQSIASANGDGDYR